MSENAAIKLIAVSPPRSIGLEMVRAIHHRDV
jgi:hypothetical protein